MPAAERFLDSLRDLIDDWKRRRRQRIGAPHQPTVRPELLAWSLATPTPVHDDRRPAARPEAYREIVLMNDHAVARLYDRRPDQRATA